MILGATGTHRAFSLAIASALIFFLPDETKEDSLEGQGLESTSTSARARSEFSDLADLTASSNSCGWAREGIPFSKDRCRLASSECFIKVLQSLTSLDQTLRAIDESLVSIAKWPSDSVTNI